MIREDRHDTSVQVAVRIRPLSDDELEVDNIHYITADPAHKQVCLKTATHDINELLTDFAVECRLWQVLKQRSHLIMYMVLTRRSSQYMTNV
jgi:hypothetical protein